METFEDLTLEEILKRVKRVSTTLSIEENRVIYSIFYDVLKLSYYRLKRKKAHIGKSAAGQVIFLKQKEIASLLTLIHRYYLNEKEYTAEHILTQCFGPNFRENDALRFFEEYVEGECKDKFGRVIKIDLEDGMRFMYKDKETGRHIKRMENYVSSRGKRLP